MGKKEGAQKGSGISLKEEGDSEEVWGDCMEVEDDAESRKKMDEQRKKMQKEFREVIVLCFKGNAGEPHGVNATSAARGGEKEERPHA